jgi:biopolymer transport protein ExbD
MKFRRRRERRVVVRWDMTPFVDVMFQLLIFFMLSSTFVISSSVPVQLPEKDTDKPVQAEARDIVVSIVADGGGRNGMGSIYLEETRVDEAELVAVLQERAAHETAANATRPPMVMIRAAWNVPTQRVVDVMEACEEAGLRSFGIGVAAKQE